MTILIGYDSKGNPEFQSSTGAGSSEYERQKAIELDQILQKRLSNLNKEIKNDQSKNKSKCFIYWLFGKLLREIMAEGLVKQNELFLFWKNVRLRAPKEVMAKDRGPNRIHSYYCFRLAEYEKSVALKMEWSEWSELFDRKGINNEERFFFWHSKKLISDPLSNSRKNIRMFTKILNLLVNGLETSDLRDDELERIYEGAWQLANELLESNQSKEFIKQNKQNILKKSADLMDGKIKPEEFARIIINTV